MMADVTLSTTPQLCTGILALMRKGMLFDRWWVVVSLVPRPHLKTGFGHESRCLICTLCYMHMHVAIIEYDIDNFSILWLLVYSAILATACYCLNRRYPATLMKPCWNDRVPTTVGVLIAVCTYWYLQKCGYVAMVYHSIRMIDIHCAYSLHGHGNETISQQANNCRLWMWRSQTGTTKSCNGLIWAITSPESIAFMLLNLFGDAIHPTDIIGPQKECL